MIEPSPLLAELRALRKAMGLKQREAAAILGLAPATISVYEGGFGNISDERIRELIKRLREGGHGRSQAADVPEPSRPAKTGSPTAAAPQARPAPVAQRYVPAPRRAVPKLKARTCPLPRGVLDENEPCICGSLRKRHDALRYSCLDCRRGSSGCQYFRPGRAFGGAR